MTATFARLYTSLALFAGVAHEGLGRTDRQRLVSAQLWPRFGRSPMYIDRQLEGHRGDWS